MMEGEVGRNDGLSPRLPLQTSAHSHGVQVSGPKSTLTVVDDTAHQSHRPSNSSSPSCPLVSVIVPTKNSGPTLERCLRSIREQSYRNVEVWVVDNYSSDNTLEIATRFTKNLIQIGPERSAQTNEGVVRARGDFIFRVDSDFTLDRTVIEEAARRALEGFDAIVVHNAPDVRVSRLARLRKFETDMYRYDLTNSAARFIRRSTFLKVGGYNSSITAGEDYDLQNRLNRAGVTTGFIEPFAIHLGEPTDLLTLLNKYYRYGIDFVNYVSENHVEAPAQLGIVRMAYVRHWRAFVRQPLLGFELMIYHTMRFVAGLAGYVVGKLDGRRHEDVGSDRYFEGVR